jgi:hypothetical protein
VQRRRLVRGLRPQGVHVGVHDAGRRVRVRGFDRRRPVGVVKRRAIEHPLHLQQPVRPRRRDAFEAGRPPRNNLIDLVKDCALLPHQARPGTLDEARHRDGLLGRRGRPADPLTQGTPEPDAGLAEAARPPVRRVGRVEALRLRPRDGGRHVVGQHRQRLVERDGAVPKQGTEVEGIEPRAEGPPHGLRGRLSVAAEGRPESVPRRRLLLRQAVTSLRVGVEGLAEGVPKRRKPLLSERGQVRRVVAVKGGLDGLDRLVDRRRGSIGSHDAAAIGRAKKTATPDAARCPPRS